MTKYIACTILVGKEMSVTVYFLLPCLTSYNPLFKHVIRGTPDEITCKVNAELYLVCPDSSKRDNHKIIAVNTDNQESCMEIWVKSELLEFGALFKNCKVEAPRPGM